MEQNVRIRSGDLLLSGVLHVPEAMMTGEQRPAIMVLHGFGSSKEAGNVVGPTRLFVDWGYIVLRFDMRGCGESDGRFGHILCLDQVADTSAALTFLRSRPEVEADRIAVAGSSFGAAVAVYTGGVDKRVSAVISSGGWGHGERKFRGQHKTADAWQAFTDMLDRGRRHREETGEELMVDRHEIVPVPEHLRTNLAPGSVQAVSGRDRPEHV